METPDPFGMAPRLNTRARVEQVRRERTARAQDILRRWTAAEAAGDRQACDSCREEAARMANEVSFERLLEGVLHQS